MSDYWPLISKFAENTGYTPKAIERKIEEGIWQEGKHYVKAPDRKIWIIPEEVKKWAKGQE